MSKSLQLCLVPLLLAAVIGCTEADRDTAGASTFVYRCAGADQAIVVTLNGKDGFLFSRQLSQALRQEQGTQAFVGDDVYYLPDQAEGIALGQTAEIVVKGSKMMDCQNNPRAAVWEDAKLRGVSYRAIGQEPPWILEIDREHGFLLVTEYGANKQQFPYVEPVSDTTRQASGYTSQVNGDSITIIIQGRKCKDSMSGEEFSSSVEVSWRAQKLLGCGRALH